MFILQPIGQSEKRVFSEPSGAPDMEKYIIYDDKIYDVLIYVIRDVCGI